MSCAGCCTRRSSSASAGGWGSRCSVTSTTCPCGSTSGAARAGAQGRVLRGARRGDDGDHRPERAGKTTIARLFLRFYDAHAGRSLIDGHDVCRVTQDSLRAAIAVVPQDAVLFNESVSYNIAFGAPGCTPAEVEKAARRANIDAFVATLPDGYATVVGERGLKLSGGEKQRIAIARAVLKRPRIFLFDEATSALDSHTERAIQENLRAVSRGTTTLIIAHRLSTVVHADEILFLDGGRIIERGAHRDLLASGGRYAALWARQLELDEGEEEAIETGPPKAGEGSTRDGDIGQRCAVRPREHARGGRR